ncbi:hypothetical protein JHK85_028043 [Glycine max]|uniref:Uncharacterized protein n=1 Tax=Glycine soja TaxID=3848 RepID=A0A0B2NQ56_GLYSO|nr:hypothetical protein JHK85_028043 [Glycine max]KHM99200.1 hypothetical protein glysoja_035465 [Glycine soja]
MLGGPYYFISDKTNVALFKGNGNGKASTILMFLILLISIYKRPRTTRLHYIINYSTWQ